MKKRQISNETFISEFIDVSAWKEARKTLINGIINDNGSDDDWKNAYKLFEGRITTRFLNPIKWILEREVNRGEGFSVVAIQCILIEFLEAFKQGKVYTTSEKPREFEYNASIKLFRDFLMNNEPFSKDFKTIKNADGFYHNIRCGLLHEAATKETSKINNVSSHNMIVFFEKNDPMNMRIYRENFNQALLEYIKKYKENILIKKEFKTNFIRKMDDICGIKHAYYFAYGSNILTSRLLTRLGKYHLAFSASLKDYEFIYNKKGKDGTAKANLQKKEGSTVYQQFPLKYNIYI